MEMCYSGALVMPSSYAMMDEEEMTYVEGGGVPRTGAIMLVDTMLMLTPLGAAFAPFKYIGKAAGKALVKRYAGAITGVLGKALNWIGGVAGSATLNFSVGSVFGVIDKMLTCCTSLGGIVCLCLDASDSQGLNGWIGNKNWKKGW